MLVRKCTSNQINISNTYHIQVSIDEPRLLVPKEYEKHQDQNEKEKKQNLRQHEPHEDPHLTKNRNKMALRKLLVKVLKSQNFTKKENKMAPRGVFMKLQKFTDFITRCAKLMKTHKEISIRVH